MDALSISAAAKERPGETFIVADGRSLNFSDVASLARAEIARLGRDSQHLRSCVTLTASPDVETIVTLLAALEARIPLALLHPRWGERERSAAKLALDSSDVHPSTSLVVFTSGTTSFPKGVCLDLGALAASAEAHHRNVPPKAGDRWLLAMPLSHVGGLSIVTRALASRSAIVLEPGFEPDRAARTIRREHVALASFVPPMLSRVLDVDPGALGHLRAVLVGGAPFSRDLRARAHAAGVNALATYGLTETASQVATQRLGAPRDPRTLDSGPPLEGLEIRTADHDGRSTVSDRPGRIQIRGPVVMLGYLGGEPIPAGAWLDTGDEGLFDSQGRLTVLGRADDTLVTGGENVHPAEVEAALLEHAGIREAVVFGLRDEVWGDIVAAAVVVEHSGSSDTARLVADATASLAPFKRPRRVVEVEAIPVSPNGKVSRKSIACELAASDRLRVIRYGPDK